jgi:hypothetical protein
MISEHPAPAVLAEALQDRVHIDIGKGRSVKTEIARRIEQMRQSETQSITDLAEALAAQQENKQ